MCSLCCSPLLLPLRLQPALQSPASDPLNAEQCLPEISLASAARDLLRASPCETWGTPQHGDPSTSAADPPSDRLRGSFKEGLRAIPVPPESAPLELSAFTCALQPRWAPVWPWEVESHEGEEDWESQEGCWDEADPKTGDDWWWEDYLEEVRHTTRAKPWSCCILRLSLEGSF